MNWNFTGRLRWNAGVLEQEQLDGYGAEFWGAVPDVLPRRDELPPQISRPDIAAALVTGEAPRVRLDGGREAAFGSDGNAGVPGEDATPEEIAHGGLASDPVTTFPAYRGASWDARRGSAFYECVINGPDGKAVPLRSTAPLQIEEKPGFWREVFYRRKPEPLHDSDRLTYETVAEILRSFSSPTTGAPGSVHSGQHGFIVYEADGLPFIVSRLAELVTLDNGRTAKDMLHKQGREIDRLEILADYQREELTRLEDRARLGLSDDPAAGATLVAVTKERDELRAALPNFESHVAELTREFDEALADARRERDELREKLRHAHEVDDRNQADAARKRAAPHSDLDLVAADLAKTRQRAVEWEQRGKTAEQALADAMAGNEQHDAFLREREANEALNAKCMRLAEEIAAERKHSSDMALAAIDRGNECDKLRGQIEGFIALDAQRQNASRELRTLRDEWQRRFNKAERERIDATNTLARIRKFCDEAPK